MSEPEIVKLLPRNVAALRKSPGASAPGASVQGTRLVTGNPVSTRLESGVGNCFPGLECDLRNLERRFFPFLEVDLGDASIDVVGIDLPGAQQAAARGDFDAAALAVYRTVARDLRAGRNWAIVRIKGTFGPLGVLDLDVTRLGGLSSGPNRPPSDAWTATRLLTEGSDVEITLQPGGRGGGSQRKTLRGRRARYLDDNGSLAQMFLPGELTQSLCSPWTHDFRDCGCFYWASNHPDIALPPKPSTAGADAGWDKAVPWERADRSLQAPPAPATAENPTSIELRHHDINRQWQILNFVLEGRETLTPYTQQPFAGRPFASVAELVTNLRYAAGVELAVVQEYLAAAYSLKPAAALAGELRDSVRAAHAEIMRVTLSEMRHLRAVNDVLASLLGRPAFKPALQVATRTPGGAPGTTKPVTPRALTPAALDDFIAIEAPSISVDGLYARILATLQQRDNPVDAQTIRTVMAEGEDHYRTFRFIKEWLAPHPPASYLRSLNPIRPPAALAEHKLLQQRYLKVLTLLHDGYEQGLPAGASSLNAARDGMLGAQGLDGAAEAIATQNFLVVFDPITPIADPRLSPIDPP
jgi:hypothetical protein